VPCCSSQEHRARGDWDRFLRISSLVGANAKIELEIRKVFLDVTFRAHYLNVRFRLVFVHHGEDSAYVLLIETGEYSTSATLERCRLRDA
jgi:hypothetical protein